MRIDHPKSTAVPATFHVGTSEEKNSARTFEHAALQGVYLPSDAEQYFSQPQLDRIKRESQAVVVGAVMLTLSAVFLAATVVLLLRSWLPTWVATLLLSGILAALALTVFASARRPHVAGEKPSAAANPPEIGAALFEEVEVLDEAFDPEVSRSADTEKSGTFQSLHAG